MFTLDEILNSTQGRIHHGDGSFNISGISTDSRSIKDGELFIAIEGVKFDGHDFIEQAKKQGAKGLVLNEQWVEKNLKSLHLIGLPVISVGNTVNALYSIASAHRNKFKIPIIAVTGSNGKTTTKEMIAAVLGNRFKVLKSQGSFNNNIGVPLSLLKIDSTHDVGVFELGMNHKGEIRSLAALVKPHIAVITNVAQAHMGNFNSINDIIEAKCEILEKLEDETLAIINVDCKDLYVKAMEYTTNLIGFGCKKKGEYQACNILSTSDGIAFTLNKTSTFKLHILGEHNVYNALAAIAVADYFDIETERIRDALKDVKPQAMRMQEFDCNGTKVIADCYNANPDSTIAAIETLAKIRQCKRRILVLGDMLELGNFSVGLHRELGKVIAKNTIEKLIAIGEHAAYTAQAAVDSGKDGKDIYRFNKNEDVLKLLKELVEPDDVVLFKASRGMHLEEIVNQLISNNTKKM